MPICWANRSSSSVTALSGNAQGSKPASGDTRNSVGSAIAARTFRIVEYGWTDPGRDHPAGEWRPHDLAVAGAAALDQCQGKAAADAWPEIARGDMPDHRRGRRAVPRRDELRPLWQHLLRVFRQQADELLAVGSRGISAGKRATAEKVPAWIIRVSVDQRGEPQIDRGHRAVGLLADNDVTLLRSQHMHRLGAVGSDAVRLAGGDQLLPEREAIIGRHVDLVAQLAGKADP